MMSGLIPCSLDLLASQAPQPRSHVAAVLTLLLMLLVAVAAVIWWLRR